MDLRIRVENVGYYRTDRDLNATPITQLKELNGHLDYLKYSIRRLPECKLNVKTKNQELKELKMESTLNYLSQMSSETPTDFISTKDLLKSITSLQTHLIHVCKVGGVIYLLKMDNKQEEKSEEIFHHFMTRKTENEPIQMNSEERGVWKAEIFDAENPKSRGFSILYSGKMGGVTKTVKGNWRHYEVGVAYGGIETDSFWWNQSCPLFWKAVFGGSPSVIVGARTGDTVFKKTFQKEGEEKKIVVTYPKNSVYEIKELTRDEIPSLAVSANNRPLWTVSDGKKNLFEFLKLVKFHVKKDGDCFVVSRIPGSQKWIFRQDFIAVRSFRETIQRTIKK